MSARSRKVHSSSRATPARRAALEVVSTARREQRYLSKIDMNILDRFELDPSDRAFAYLLAHGSVSLQFSLDTLIDSALRSPKDIKPAVRDALRLSAYEIIYLHKEDHAAVDQGVELVRSVASRASGVANHVLHRIVEQKDLFPYGDPTRSLEAAALFYGFPAWFAQKLEEDLGMENALCVMRASLDEAPVWFTPNALRIADGNLAEELQMAAIEYDTCRSLMDDFHPSVSFCNHQASIYKLVHRFDVGAPLCRSLLAKDKIVVSDLSAQSIVLRAVETLSEHKARLLEIGAGRGTKTLQFQSACERKGLKLVEHDVMDVKAARIEALINRIAQAGGTLNSAFIHDATQPFSSLGLTECPKENAYDLVFIDAPCSGVGTLRRHPEIKARLAQKNPLELAKIGQAMMQRAAALVKPGGYLMYATCTVFKEENEKNIERFLASSAGVEFCVVPIGVAGAIYFNTPIEVNGPDQHFAALLQRISR